MKCKTGLFLVLIVVILSCKNKTSSQKETPTSKGFDYVLAFGSCNNQFLENALWEPILENEADVFVWGGDIVYSDTDDMDLMRENYQMLKSNVNYRNFAEKLKITGVWDDHDYGLNDGGRERVYKDSVQEVFLDFFEVEKNSPRRAQAGIYHSLLLEADHHQIKLFLLDTRYFRTALRKDPLGIKRYVPNDDPGATILGEPQWTWLERELSQSTADFNIVMSSIQFLSSDHGFESWGNMPLERERMENLLRSSKAKNVIILSGDRHLAEISKKQLKGLDYPLIDFTSSGMTHSYESYSGEVNPYRISSVVSKKNFGLLKFDFNKKMITMEIRGIDNILYDKIKQSY